MFSRMGRMFSRLGFVEPKHTSGGGGGGSSPTFYILGF